jgi:hypothetical protein
MENKPPPDVFETTRLLKAWSEGDATALEQLVPLVDAEMHRLARKYLQQERPGHILQTTALVDEAWIRLINWQDMSWQNRAHFILTIINGDGFGRCIIIMLWIIRISSNVTAAITSRTRE